MFDEIAKQIWLQLGAIGLLIILLVVGLCYLTRLITRIMQEHKGERNEWRNEAKGQTEKMFDVVEQNSTAVSKLCTIIKSRAG